PQRTFPSLSQRLPSFHILMVSSSPLSTGSADTIAVRRSAAAGAAGHLTPVRREKQQHGDYFSLPGAGLTGSRGLVHRPSAQVGRATSSTPRPARHGAARRPRRGRQGDVLLKRARAQADSSSSAVSSAWADSNLSRISRARSRSSL